MINALAFENETAATRLLKMATNAGVKFSGEQLVEMCLICEEGELERAIRHSCDIFTDADIDVLYGCFDDELYNFAFNRNWACCIFLESVTLSP